MHTGTADIERLHQLFNGDMRPGVAVEILSEFDQLFPTRRVARGEMVREFPRRHSPFPDVRFIEHGKICDLNDFLATNRVAGLLVLKDGMIALEEYGLGIGPQTRWASCSIAKSFASTMVGAAIRDGYIASLDDPVCRYVPALRGGVYERVSVGQVLTMTSGVQWDETYTNPDSERRRLLKEQCKIEPGAVLRFMSALQRAAEPGSIWKYNTGETYVLGAVVEGATDGPLSDYLSEKLWVKAGMEQDSAWWIESPNGMVVAGSGMVATLRDYGRFGQIILDNGRVNGKLIVPDNWFPQAGLPHVINGKPLEYGYSWWIPPQTDPIHVGAFQAVGIYGQYIYINPREHLVIVLLSARSKPSVLSRLEWTDEIFFSAVAKALQ